MVSDVFPVGTVVATPFAYDDVDTTPSFYSYKLHLQGVLGSDGRRLDLDPSASLPLTIQSVTGQVIVNEDLRRFPDMDRMDFAVEAVDMRDKKLRATARLIVQVAHGPISGEGCCCIVPCNNATTPSP